MLQESLSRVSPAKLNASLHGLCVLILAFPALPLPLPVSVRLLARFPSCCLSSAAGTCQGSRGHHFSMSLLAEPSLRLTSAVLQASFHTFCTCSVLPSLSNCFILAFLPPCFLPPPSCRSYLGSTQEYLFPQRLACSGGEKTESEEQKESKTLPAGLISEQLISLYCSFPRIAKVTLHSLAMCGGVGMSACMHWSEKMGWFVLYSVCHVS